MICKITYGKPYKNKYFLEAPIDLPSGAFATYNCANSSIRKCKVSMRYAYKANTSKFKIVEGVFYRCNTHG